MTNRIDWTQFFKDFKEGKSYAEIALKHKSSVATVACRVKRLGLKRDRKKRELFSEEERDILRGLLDNYRGRKQLSDILRSK